jgi:DNA-binding NtrC family response regulator
MLRLVITCDDRVRRVPLSAGTTTIGSTADNDVVIACTGVSKRHATLSCRGETLVLEDAGSKNGLIVGGKRVPRVELAPGDGVGVGRAVVQLERVSTSDATIGLMIEGRSDAHAAMPARTSDIQTSGAGSILRWLRDAEEYDSASGGERRRDLLRAARELMGSAFIIHCTFSVHADLVFNEINGVVPSDAETAELSALLATVDEARPLRAVDHHDWIIVPLGARQAIAVHCAPRLLRGDDRPALLEFVALRLFSSRDAIRTSTRTPAALAFPPAYVNGSSAAIGQFHAELVSASRSRAHVLVRGERGAGKEFIAEILHRSGSNAKGAFRAINCAAIPAELLESELFGVGQRVATGVDRRRGMFLDANHGTLFLDEIGDLPLPLQPKLLRVLQEREVQQLGASQPIKVDVRIVAATNRDLEQMQREGRFRSDLYDRLRVIELHVPPLRQRRDDIPALVSALLPPIAETHRKHVTGVTRKALTLLISYDWPGNIRELQSVLERAVGRCTSGNAIEASDVDLPITSTPSSSLQSSLAASEREAILDALRRANGNKSEAARLLGITRPGLYLKLRRLKID